MKQIISHYLNLYISNWDYCIEKEVYKWQAYKHFEENINYGDVSFAERLNTALEKTDNLLRAFRYLPADMIKHFSGSKPMLTQALFEHLYNEEINIMDRILAFIHGAAQLVGEMTEEGYSDWNSKNNVASYQDVHAVSVYLSMMYPDRYYIYNYGVLKTLVQRIGYKITSSRPIDRFLEFQSLCDVVKGEIRKDATFVRFYKEWLKKKNFKDDNLNILTQDFIYAIVVHLNSDSYKKANKKRTLQREYMEVDASEFVTIVTKVKENGEGQLGVDYEKLDKLHRDIGLMGEMWAINYEKERLKQMNIDTSQVKHASKVMGDGIGYDIQSVEDDGITPRYIEVKTTTGSLSQPFYFSYNELLFSAANKLHYYTYRVYNFKNATQQADILVVHGSLEDLHGCPLSFKVSLKNIAEV